MSEKINWKKIIYIFLICCGRCNMRSKCSKCMELEIKPTPILPENEINNEITN